MKYKNWIQKADNGERSPSVWREWIEIPKLRVFSRIVLSPSVWREWIEIRHHCARFCDGQVSLRVEGVD